MKDGICSKCGAAEVFINRDGPAMGAEWHRRIPISISTGAAVQYFVCAACGYVETYLADLKYVEKIRELWSKVPER